MNQNEKKRVPDGGCGCPTVAVCSLTEIYMSWSKSRERLEMDIPSFNSPFTMVQ